VIIALYKSTFTMPYQLGIRANFKVSDLSFRLWSEQKIK